MGQVTLLVLLNPRKDVSCLICLPLNPTRRIRGLRHAPHANVGSWDNDPYVEYPDVICCLNQAVIFVKISHAAPTATWSFCWVKVNCALMNHLL